VEGADTGKWLKSRCTEDLLRLLEQCFEEALRRERELNQREDSVIGVEGGDANERNEITKSRTNWATGIRAIPDMPSNTSITTG
jgi:hypothetical protein